MVLTYALDGARAACVDSIESFVRAADSFSEHDLLGASRCHGWTRLDVVVHVIAGWQEMLGGLVRTTEAEPTVDAGSYWTAFAEQYGDEDDVDTLMAQRRRTASYARPASAIAQLGDVAEALLQGLRRCRDEQRSWQGHVFTAGDYLAVWAVEDVVHQLDLDADEPAPTSALVVTRATVEALLGESAPSSWDDVTVALVGAGRAPAPPGAGGLAARLPVLG